MTSSADFNSFFFIRKIQSVMWLSHDWSMRGDPTNRLIKIYAPSNIESNDFDHIRIIDVCARDRASDGLYEFNVKSKCFNETKPQTKTTVQSVEVYHNVMWSASSSPIFSIIREQRASADYAAVQI